MPPAEGSAATEDAILLALAHVCSVFGMPFDRHDVLSALPAGEGALPRSLFVRAARAAGLDAVMREELPSRTPPLVAPFVAFLKDGSCAVVERVDHSSGVMEVAMPRRDSTVRRTIETGKVDAMSAGNVGYVTPLRSPPAAIEDRDGLLSRDHLVRDILAAYWPSWLLVAVAAGMINLLALASPLFIMNVYDRVLPNLALPTLWALASGVAIALLFDAALKQARSSLLDRTGNRVDMQIGAELFARILRIRMDAFPAGTGALANTVREAETVREFFTSASLVAVTDMLFIGLFLVVLWMISGPLALVPAAAVLAVVAITLATRKPLESALRDSAAEMSQRQTLLVETLTGLETLRLAAAEPKRQHGWERAVMASADGASRAKFWSSVANVSTSFILQFVGVTVIVWGVFLVLEGRITVGALIAANLLSGRVLQPLASITQTLARSGQAIQAMQRIKGLMALPVEDDGAVSASEVEDGAIEFRSVTFTYPGADRPALREVSFSISPGEKVGVIGAVGSGKSTIGKLVAGLYDAADGAVLIDGKDIRQYSRASLRAAVSCAGQDSQLFSGSLRDNIALGARSATEADIELAAEIAGVAEFASVLPEGLATRVSERGANFSGGQRQAVALARALVRSPKVVFLDEPTSAMDAARESRFIARLSSWCAGRRTLIVATHKTNVLAIVDRLIVLDNGKVVAAGPRDAVLAELKRRQGEERP